MCWRWIHSATGERTACGWICFSVGYSALLLSWVVRVCWRWCGPIQPACVMRASQCRKQVEGLSNKFSLWVGRWWITSSLRRVIIEAVDDVELRSREISPGEPTVETKNDVVEYGIWGCALIFLSFRYTFSVIFSFSLNEMWVATRNSLGEQNEKISREPTVQSEHSHGATRLLLDSLFTQHNDSHAHWKRRTLILAPLTQILANTPPAEIQTLCVQSLQPWESARPTLPTWRWPAPVPVKPASLNLEVGTRI